MGTPQPIDVCRPMSPTISTVNRHNCVTFDRMQHRLFGREAAKKVYEVGVTEASRQHPTGASYSIRDISVSKA